MPLSFFTQFFKFDLYELTQSIFRALKRDPDWAYLMIVWLQTFYAFKFFAKCFNFNLHNIVKGILQALGRDLVHLQTFW